jgi:hypothetical protein
MALLHNAQLVPGKLELLRAWLPTQPWFAGAPDAVEAAGAYRFDDPTGEVGIETHLLSLEDGRVVQVPLTYRAAPLAGADAALLDTLQHSALGQRWVYDGCFDPVYATALATTILTGGCEAELQLITDTGLVRREATTHVRGAGTSATIVAPIHSVMASTEQATTAIRAGNIELLLRRVLDHGGLDEGAGELTLTGVWPGHDEPVVLAVARHLPAPSRG